MHIYITKVYRFACLHFSCPNYTVPKNSKSLPLILYQIIQLLKKPYEITNTSLDAKMIEEDVKEKLFKANEVIYFLDQKTHQEK